MMRYIQITGRSFSGKSYTETKVRESIFESDPERQIQVHDNIVFLGTGYRGKRRFGLGEITTQKTMAKTILLGLATKYPDHVVFYSYTRTILDDRLFRNHETIVFVNTASREHYAKHGNKLPLDEQMAIQEKRIAKYRDRLKPRCTEYIEWPPEMSVEEKVAQVRHYMGL